MKRRNSIKKIEELMEFHSETLSEASKLLKEFIFDSALMESLEITKKAAERGGVYICAIGEKSKVNAAMANLIATKTDPRETSYSNFSKSKNTLKDIYRAAKMGLFAGRNVLIFADPNCRKAAEVIRRTMRAETKRLIKEAMEEGENPPLPQNVIYLKYTVKKGGSYLEKISLYPFDGVPNPVFRKKPDYVDF